MYRVGEFVVYGVTGVCRVERVGEINLSESSKGKKYYTLVPVYAKGSKLFTPIDSKKVLIRHVLTKEEALSLIDEIPDIDEIWVEDIKKREIIYKETLRKCDCRECIRIIKTLYLRNEMRVQSGKKISGYDERYLHAAKEFLYGELAIALGIGKDQVEEFIIEKVEESK